MGDDIYSSIDGLSDITSASRLSPDRRADLEEKICVACVEKKKRQKLLELESREKLLRIQHLRIAAEHEEELEKQRSQLEQEKGNIQLDTDLEILKAQLNVSSENLALLD